MKTLTNACPCCGRQIDEAADMQWDAESGTFTYQGKALRLSRIRSLIFDALWRARGRRIISHQQMMEHVYADDPNGGPESTNIISVQVNHLKKKLAPFGLTVTGFKGYALIDLPDNNQTKSAPAITARLPASAMVPA